MFSNKKKYEEGYSNVIEPEPMPEEIKEGEDYQFLDFIQKDDENDKLPENSDRYRRKNPKPKSFPVILFFYFVLLIFALKFGFMIKDFENFIIRNYPHFVFSYLNPVLSFFVVTGLSLAVVFAYRFLMYHLQPKKKAFFSLSFVKKLMLFIVITNLLLYLFFILELYVVNNINFGVYYTPLVNIAISSLCFDALIILFFVFGVFVLFIFFSSLFPKQFFKSKLVIFILSLIVISFFAIVLSSGISSFFVFLNFSPAVNVTGQVAVSSPFVDKFSLIGNKVLYSYYNHSFDTLAVVSLKNNVSRDLENYARVCKISSTLGYFVVLYGDSSKNSCKNLAVFNSSGKFLYDLSFGFNVSIATDKGSNLIAVSEKNSVVRLVNITNTSAVPFRSITLAPSQSLKCFSDFAYAVTNNNLSVVFPSQIYDLSGRNLANLSNNVIDCFIFGNLSKFNVLSKVRTISNQNLIYLYTLSKNKDKAYKSVKRVVYHNGVSRVFFSKNKAFVIMDNGDLYEFGLFDFSSESLTNYANFLFDDVKTNGNVFVWKKSFGISFVRPFNQLLYFKLR